MQQPPLTPTRRSALAAIGALGLAAGSGAFGQAYPSRPIRIVISTGAGGITDIIFRALGDELGKRLGQPVLIDNKPGANGLIAAQAVKSAAPDGYTFYGGDLTKVSSVFLLNSLDAMKELAPVSGIVAGDFFLYVPATLKVANMHELAAFARTQPGGLRTSTVATYLHMILSLVGKRANFQFENIPYRTSGEVIQALINGDVHATLNAAGGFTGQVSAGKLRVLAALGPRRSTLFPDVPTLKEQGVPVELMYDFGLWAPLKTPQDVVMKVNAAVAESLKQPALAARIHALGLIASPTTPEQLLVVHRDSNAVNAEAANLIGFKAQ